MTNEKHDEVSELINIVEREGFGKASLEKQLAAIRELGFTNDNRALEYLNGLAEQAVLKRTFMMHGTSSGVISHPKAKGALYDALRYFTYSLDGSPMINIDDTCEIPNTYYSHCKCIGVIRNSIVELRKSL